MTTAATDNEGSAAHPRFAEALRDLGLAEVAGQVRRFPGAARTAPEAAAAIGGVPPFGHRTTTRVLADRSLLDHDLVRAAAGTPYTVSPREPKTLIAHAGGTLADVRERSE
ncbi:hypothetical protein WJ438_24460 [Streptomyces sp. GD-15H]|uniref:hypothetical protein n=1 Tax=Streptomyces sp. GD-15H TaxID=3129112 RepID=UPI00324A8497